MSPGPLYMQSVLERIKNVGRTGAGMTLMPGHLPEEQRNILRAVALAYRRVMRSPEEPAATRAEEARLAQKRQSYIIY